MTARVARLGGKPPNRFAAISLQGLRRLCFPDRSRLETPEDWWVVTIQAEPIPAHGSGGALQPPRIEAVVVVLPRDLPVPELEPHREVRAHLRIRGQGIGRHSQKPAPENFERDAISRDDRIEDLEALGAQSPLAPARGLEDRGEIPMSANWREPVRKFFLNHILREVLREHPTFSAILQRFEVSACDCEIVGRGHRHDVISEIGCGCTANLQHIRDFRS